jgi:iron complex transport system ATP-binding protein
VTVGVVHDLNLAARFADQVVLLSEGRVVAKGAASEVLTAENIRSVFSVEPTFVSHDQSQPYIVFD